MFIVLMPVSSFQGWAHTPPPGGVGLAGLRALLKGVRYLQDEVVTLSVGGGGGGADSEEDSGSLLRIYGSPWEPQWQGFETYRSDTDARATWAATMPDDTDVVRVMR